MEKYFTLDEIKKHSNVKSCWIVIHGSVYDLTKYLKDHPGGPNVLLEYAGLDGSFLFDRAAHSKKTKAHMENYKIGEVSDREI